MCARFRLGFAAEQIPRHIIPSRIEDAATGGTKNLFNYSDDVEFYNQAVKFFEKLFFKYILVNPKDRKVVLVESVLCPTKFRETFARVLFCHFEVHSIYHVPLHLVSLCTLAIDTGLVVDLGYSEAIVIPVFSGVQVINAWEAQPLAAEAVHEQIKEKLILDNVASEDCLTDEVVEDIKTRACFVTTRERALKHRNNEEITPPKEADYPIKGDEIIQIPGTLRETAFERLFPEDEDRSGLPYIILESILKCPLDMRKVLAENIFLIGGTAMALGLKDRLKHELLALIESPYYADRLHVKEFKFHSGISQPNYTGWLGGSIYGATDMVNSGALTRESYLKDRKLPDVTRIDTNGDSARTI